MKSERKKLQNMSIDELMAYSSSGDENDSSLEDSSAAKTPKKKKEKKTLLKNKLSKNSKNDSINKVIYTPMQGEKRKSKTENETSQKKRTKIDKLGESIGIKSSEENIVYSNDWSKNILEKSSSIDGTQCETDSEYSETDERTLQMAMGKLKEKDPEFYKFLEENDKELLEFAASDDDNDDDESQQKEMDEDDEESIEGDADDKVESRKVNKKLIEKWITKLQQQPDFQTLRKVVTAFKAAVHEASGEAEDSNTGFHVVGSTEFNAVVQLCMEHFVPSLHKLLKLPEPSTSGSELHFDPSKRRGWKKAYPVVKSYLDGITKLLTVTSEPAVASALLKHILHLVPFYLTFAKMSRALLKKVILFWCTGEEAVRVVAFLVIIRLVRSLSTQYLDYALKQMYLSYVKNCKFVSPTTWPLINFMKRSLVELYSLNESIAYQHAFIYIRQLSIHLRNAVTVKKKDSYQAVYNWQYVHCLLLWVHLLSTLPASPILKPLVYPLTQTAIGTISLIPTSKYIPLRFHLVRGLIQLSSDTDTFIPILPLIFEPLDIMDFNKKLTAVSMKPLDFSCALKLSKSQLQENGFKDTVIENMYNLLIEYLNTQANRIAFPELVLPTIVRIKSFMKKCKVSNYCRKFKQLVDKIQENADKISEKRKSVGFQLSDSEAIKKWEEEVKEQGIPLQNFYKSWKKLRDNPAKVSKKTEETT